MTIKLMPVLLIPVSALLFCAATLAFANGQQIAAVWNSNNNPSGTTNLSADLSGGAGFLGVGFVRYNADSKGSSLEAAIQLPVDGTTLRDSHAAAGTTFTLIISNGAGTIANCTLGLTDIGFNNSSTTTEIAEYQTSIFESGKTLTSHDGSCSGASLPTPISGDTISVTLTGGSSTTPVLSGIFSASLVHRR